MINIDPFCFVLREERCSLAEQCVKSSSEGRLLCVCLDEVAVIDEIQMIRDPSRGWAWTRALLGL